MKALDGRVALVTGAANGVGLGIATVLQAEGARVASLDLTDSAVGMALRADVSDPAQLQAAADTVLAEWGRIDILAANAGIYPEAHLGEITDELLDAVLGLNVKGAVHAIQACLPAMRERRFGRIVLTSSITGPLVGQPGYGVYGSSKAAMLGMMRSFALELAGDGITINAVQPGNVRTAGFSALESAYQQQMLDAIPMRRLAEPEDVGWAVRFLASEEAGYITGQTIVLDGGQVLPEGAA